MLVPVNIIKGNVLVIIVIEVSTGGNIDRPRIIYLEHFYLFDRGSKPERPPA